MRTERAIAEIDLANLRHNLGVVRKHAQGARILAMVKGNAYGHGMVTAAKHLRDVDYFGVACIEAALALRHSGVMQPIVLTTGFQNPNELKVLLDNQIEPVVFDSIHIKHLCQAEVESPIRVWLKIDTGMHRLGFDHLEVAEAYEKLRSSSNVSEIVLMTHFACADQENNREVLEQFNRFISITENYDSPKSAANSGAILQYPNTILDIVRPGLMLYGVSPRLERTAEEDGLKPVMTFKSKIIGMHQLEVGDSVGYGSTWKALRPTKIAVVSAGYGDGYPQMAKEGTPVLVHGKTAFLSGRVSMDTMTVDVTDIEDVQLGDDVILWGEGLPIEKVAAAMDASPYALLTGITPRVNMDLQEIA